MQDFPLRPGLEIFEAAHDGFYYPDDERVIIREFWDSSWFNDPYESVKEVMSLFKELRLFDINVVDFKPIVFNKDRYLFAVDYIDGVGFLEDYVELNDPQKQKANKLFENLREYLTYKIQSGESFPADIYGLHQYMFAEDEMVLVDLEPMIVDDREINFSRFGSEMDAIGMLFRSAVQLYDSESVEFDALKNYARNLVTLAAEKNGVLMVKEWLDKFIEASLIKRDIDETNDLINDLIDSNDNIEFRQRMRTKLKEFANDP